MPKTVLVISDTHLGGRPGFQICSPAGRELLADFLEWVSVLAATEPPVHLVVNGDLVDFLAEPPFESFTADAGDAARKLEAIIESSEEIWTAFRRIVAAGAELTVLLGNHDLELTLPEPCSLLRKTLGVGSVNFLFDNQALDLGDVLIEHGNRYDAWNIVNHNALRQVRSAISRREVPDRFPVPAGSRLVIDVMNELKKELHFIDLLKPENDAVLPLIAALAPVSGAQIRDVVRYYHQKRQVRFGADQVPLDSGNIADTDFSAPMPEEPGDRLARELLAAEGSDDQAAIGFSDDVDFLHLWRAARTPERRSELIRRLYVALRHRLGAQVDAFSVNAEAPEYLTAASSSASRGFKVIVYGHTHLAKRVQLPGGATYLNTGTWADLMMLPPSVIQGNELAALGELEAFVQDLEANRLDRRRGQLPTFARIDMDGKACVAADIHVYDGNGRSRPVPQAIEPRSPQTVRQKGE